jgi:hypothetical protein
MSEAARIKDRFETHYIPEPNSKPERLKHQKLVGKPCKNCGGTLRYGRSYSCVICTNKRSMERKATPAYRVQAKRYWMEKRYGLTPEKVEQKLHNQGGVCACCGADSPGNKNGWSVDHDHKSGSVRGVLCHGCNVGLGGFKDSLQNLERAVKYLTAWQNHA